MYNSKSGTSVCFKDDNDAASLQELALPANQLISIV